MEHVTKLEIDGQFVVIKLDIFETDRLLKSRELLY